MTEVGVNNEGDESNENSSSSDEPETPEKEPSDYEKQRDLRVSQNKAKMEALGLQRIANSLIDLGQKKGKGITQLRRSKRVSKNSKDDDYEPNHDDDDDDDDDGDGDGSSEEREDEGSGKKKKINKKKKKVRNGCETMMVDVPPKVLIPDSSLQFTGYCQEKIHLVFPKAPEDEVKKLMDRFPKGFNGFNHEQGERALRWIAGLKDDYWLLRRTEVEYPEFREEEVEGLPFPEGFKGFNLEESKQISRVIVTLEAAYSRLRDYFDEGAKDLAPSVHCEASGPHPLEASGPPTTQVLCPQQQASSFIATPVHPDAQMLPYRVPGSRPSVHHEASGSHPLETPWQPTTQVSGPQQQTSTVAASPVQSDVLMSSRVPNYRQFPPNWCPPFGMAMPWNPYNANYPQPSMGNYPGMPYYDAGMRPSMGNYPGMPYYDPGMRPPMGNYPGMPYSYSNGNA